MSAPDTVVLIHGAWADTSSWNGTIDALRQAGYTARAIANPLRNLTTDSTYVADFLKTIPTPIVLAGHSYGGSVITNAATGNPNVKALVYIDAAAPDTGETTAQLSGTGSALNVAIGRRQSSTQFVRLAVYRVPQKMESVQVTPRPYGPTRFPQPRRPWSSMRRPGADV